MAGGQEGVLAGSGVRTAGDQEELPARLDRADPNEGR